MINFFLFTLDIIDLAGSRISFHTHTTARLFLSKFDNFMIIN